MKTIALVVLLLLSSCLATPRDPAHLTYRINPGFSDAQKWDIHAAIVDWEVATSGRFHADEMVAGDALPDLEFEPAKIEPNGNIDTNRRTYGSYSRIALYANSEGQDAYGVKNTPSAEHFIGLSLGIPNDPATEMTIMAYPQHPEVLELTPKDVEHFFAVWGH